MPTNQDKNLEYVKKSQMKKNETLRAEAYYETNADAEQRHRDESKATMGADEYRKQQTDYMKKYRATKKHENWM